jgi:c(7)-type cytochrome triheme protein
MARRRAQQFVNSQSPTKKAVQVLIGFLFFCMWPIFMVTSEPSVPAQTEVDYSRFSHANANHSRLACLLCHRREGGASRPALPGESGHQPCVGCHAKQFSDSSSPICGVCHTKPPAPELKAFPSLKSFNVRFDHSLHLRGAARSTGCATCHRPARNGIALSIPVGSSAHAVCYQCHGPHAQIAKRDISSCGTCHRLGGYTRTSSNAGAFRVGFSHDDHDASGSLQCADCHSVRAGMPQRRQVTSPVPLNHHASAGTLSCMTCHNGTRAFGGDDFSVCIRCHTGKAWHF